MQATSIFPNSLGRDKLHLMPSAVAHAIIGTAGHIDHGKTALIRALTGQETDRLKEEQERGISIDLGFAFFTLPDGTRAGVVDVPGHERFIRNMLAGAHGIDLVLFTVAADDGVMPQSEEHLDILHLLGVSRGIFVVTKADLVNADRLKEVRAEIELLADGTQLATAPTIAVSSVTGAGLEELRSEMARQLVGFDARRATGVFRLPLDRAFAIKGHGTIVTGTAMGAEVRVGQKLRVLPGGAEVRVRGVQVHSESVPSAGRCQRVALNLAGPERVELRRGQVLADDRLDFATSRFDAWLEIRPAAKRPLRNHSRLRLFVGTSEILGRVILLEDRDELPPKERGLVQIVTEHPAVLLFGDRFVIRDETNVRTLGGGIVLNPIARRSRKPPAAYRDRLATIRGSQGAAEAVEALLNLQESLALPAGRLACLMNRPLAEIEGVLTDARFIKLSMGDEEGFTTRSKWEELKKFTLATLGAHHQAAPLAAGLEMESLRTRLPYEVSARAFRAIVDRVGREAEIVREESMLRLKSHKVKLGGDAEELGARVETTLTRAEFQPPDLKQLAEQLGLGPGAAAQLRTVLGAMEREGRVVKITAELYFGRSALDAARTRLVDYLGTHTEITAAIYRDLLGASRKFAIALLDYFDHSGLTTRVGDQRRLRARTG